MFALATPAAGATRTNVGVVGLGAGTMGAYASPEMAISFFEIDPVVTRVAQDPRYFTYLTDAPDDRAVVLGDARLSLEEEPAGQFDLVSSTPSPRTRSRSISSRPRPSTSSGRRSGRAGSSGSTSRTVSTT